MKQSLAKDQGKLFTEAFENYEPINEGISNLQKFSRYSKNKIARIERGRKN